MRRPRVRVHGSLNVVDGTILYRVPELDCIRSHELGLPITPRHIWCLTDRTNTATVFVEDIYCQELED